MEVCSLSYEEVAESLESRARRKKTVTYNELANELQLPPVNNRFGSHPLKPFFEQLDA